MYKQTKLNDNADIYQPRTEKTEKQKLHDMNFKEKASYLWVYYRMHALITIAVIGIIIYIIHSIITPNVEVKLSVAMINNAFETEEIEQLKNDLSNHLNLDPKTEEVNINTTFMFTDSFDMNTRQVLSTFIMAGEIDVIIAPESQIASYAYYGTFSKLADQLPTDLYSSLTNNFYFSTQEEFPEKEALGIYLTDCSLYKNYNDPSDPFVLALVGNSGNKENAIELIRYLFEIFP